MHFVANADDAAIANVLAQVKAETTLFSIASKSFGTPETLLNAHAARDWFLQQGMSEADIRQHFIAISTNHPAVQAFGIAPERTFAMFDWVGGRYSTWSAIGFPLMVAVGTERFREFLAGAHVMDEHFFNTPFRHNIPVLLALLGVWYSNFYGAESQAVIPYSHPLRRFAAHLQQLDMESNGKHTTAIEGEEVSWQTWLDYLGRRRCKLPARLFPADSPRYPPDSGGLYRADDHPLRHRPPTSFLGRQCLRPSRSADARQKL